MTNSEESRPLFRANGVDGETGLPLCELNASAILQLLRHELRDGRAKAAAVRASVRAKFERATQSYYGVTEVDDPNDLAETGWGILFAQQSAESARIQRLLEPLLARRREQAGERYRCYGGEKGLAPGQGAHDWLRDRGVALEPVNPIYGVPYYILLVGSPEEIPFDFQFLIDLQFAVGRLYFEDLQDYRRYAESVVAYETAKEVEQARALAIFAPENGDVPTTMFAQMVAEPLVKGEPPRGERPAIPPIGLRREFAVRSSVGEEATKEQLGRIYRPAPNARPPAVLFTGSHGLGVRADHPQFAELQGALVCQEWQAQQKRGEPSPIPEEARFQARDLPTDARVHGLIQLFFACFSAGCPEYDDFADANVERRRIAPASHVARLPRSLLAHPEGGALAALGHVDRAWPHSFWAPDDWSDWPPRELSGYSQLQGFRGLIDALLKGDRIGHASDQFDVRRAAFSHMLVPYQQKLLAGARGAEIEAKVAQLWVARNDARNYALLGDPAARLRVEALPEEAASP